ncbi:DUF2971 domain-containing protein [Buttiauxella noackiae]|uniref:DUF2971 domain-containing protein n=1 Tax=Buttiauxella noackiae TaxID=82992 RepID=UPI00054E0A8C|nr:DUF2971 domain-containing protein [Buttiauxella noackiae]
MNNEKPTTLYKYKKFDTFTLDALVNDKVFLANPDTFNDPLDCKPHILDDIFNTDELLEILEKMVYRKALINNYANHLPLIKLYGSIDRFYKMIDSLTLDYVENYTKSIKGLYSSDPNDYKLILLNNIEDHLSQKGTGILSLASDYKCPLMWSHYGDQHNGLCIGYKPNGEINEFFSKKRILEVDYDSPRTVETSLTKKAFLEGSQDAEDKIDEIIYSRKANQWKYEKEYRMIGQIGLTRSPFILSDITFGLRCNNSVIYSVMMALSHRPSTRDKSSDAVNFYKIRETKGSFDLEREKISLDDLWSLPKEHQYNKNVL